MPLFKKANPTPELTNERYQWWLEAQRPPFEWFLGLSAIEQETLANIGVAHAQDLALAIGHAVSDPTGGEQSLAARNGDASAEESLIKQLAQGFARRLQAAREEPAPVEAPERRETLAGHGERRTETHTSNKREPTLFGGQPDGVAQ